MMGMMARKRAEEQFDERFFFWRTDAEYRRLMQQKLPTAEMNDLKSLPKDAALIFGA